METGREASHTGVCWGEIGEGQWRVGSWGEMPDIGDGRKAANHTAISVPMQQSFMFFTCTPNLKCNLKKVTIKREIIRKKKEYS